MLKVVRVLKEFKVLKVSRVLKEFRVLKGFKVLLEIEVEFLIPLVQLSLMLTLEPESLGIIMLL